MNTLGERLNYARKQKGYTQDSLAQTIGVSRGVIFNLEKNKTEPQAIVINAVCQILKINKEWLTDGTGDMESGNQAFQSAKLLEELYNICLLYTSIPPAPIYAASSTARVSSSSAFLRSVSSRWFGFSPFPSRFGWAP